VGEKAGPFEDDASASRLQKFAQAVGAENRMHGFPTFLTVCRKGEFELMQRFGIPLARVLHGEQEYEFANPIIQGSKLAYETRLADVLEKRGKSAALHFMIFETKVTSAGRDIGVARSTIIYREAV
jgi:hypothetical protein